MFGLEGRRLVAVARDAEFFPHAFGYAAGKFGAFFEGYACHGHEGQHVGGAAARMGSVVHSHIDEFLSLFGSLERCFANCFGAAGEGDHGAVGSLARVHVKHLHSLAFRTACLGYRIDYPVDYGFVASFAEIGDAFNNSGH